MKNVKITCGESELIILFTWFKNEAGDYNKLNIRGFFQDSPELKEETIDLHINRCDIDEMVRLVGELYDSYKLINKDWKSPYNIGEKNASKGFRKMIFCNTKKSFRLIEHSTYQYFLHYCCYLTDKQNFIDCLDWEYNRPDKIQVDADFLKGHSGLYYIVSEEFSELFQEGGVNHGISADMLNHPIHYKLNDKEMSYSQYRELMKKYIQDKNLVNSNIQHQQFNKQNIWKIKS